MIAALSRELTPDRVVDVVLEQANQGLGAVAGTLRAARSRASEIVLVGNVGYSEAGSADWSAFPLDLDVPMTAAVRSGEGLYLSDSEAAGRALPGVRRGGDPAPLARGAAADRRGHRPRDISLSFDTRRDFDRQERAFLFAATQQAAHALARARSYEGERSEAERQRFLAEAGELLSESLDPEAALQRLAQLAVANVADWCGIELPRTTASCERRRGPRGPGPGRALPRSFASGTRSTPRARPEFRT